MENDFQMQIEENPDTENPGQGSDVLDKSQYGRKIPVEIGEETSSGQDEGGERKVAVRIQKIIPPP